MFKRFVQAVLEHYVKRYFKKHPDVQLIVVAGSVGKTTTKMAIATVLAEQFRVRVEEGNHNAELSAPLAILGIEYPTNIRSITQWREVFKAAKIRIQQPTDVDVIVQELGTDRIGQLPHFGKYLKPQLAVITAVADEHMEFFKTLDAVAMEELSAANFSEMALINRDDIDGKYADDITNPYLSTYGSSGVAEYRFEETDFRVDVGYTGNIISPDGKPIPVQVNVIGEAATRAVAAAAAVGIKLGMGREQLASGIAKIVPVSGRMNLLRGQDESYIIDDTYNSSPRAVTTSLATLYQVPAPQKIAVLGDMTELGDMSAEAHAYAGTLCTPSQLDWVITVGAQSEKYLADEARKQGCQVRSFQNAQQAGAFVHQVMTHGSVILFKGSQNNGYLEEAIKIVLHDTRDEAKLVRQSTEWIHKKEAYFAQFDVSTPED